MDIPSNNSNKKVLDLTYSVLPVFFLGISQYGLLHLGQTLGLSSDRVIHWCPQRSQMHLRTLISLMPIVVLYWFFPIYSFTYALLVKVKFKYYTNYIPIVIYLR